MKRILRAKFEGVTYELDENKIPPNSCLNAFVTDDLTSELPEMPLPKGVHFEPVFLCLRDDTVPASIDVKSFNFFAIDETDFYDISMIKEKFLIENISKYGFLTQLRRSDPDVVIPSYEQLTILGLPADKEGLINAKVPCIEPYFGLNKVTEDFWNKLIIGRSKKERFMFEDVCRLNKESWTMIQYKLALYKKFVDIPNVFLGGGAIFSVLFGEPIRDIDLFIYGCSEEEAIKTIYRCGEIYREHVNAHRVEGESQEIVCTRTSNSISFKSAIFDPARDLVPLQVILRLYQTPSEVLHGFDIDSCCMGWNGEDIWLTNRCLFALRMGYNTFNLDKMSEVYEVRSAKYGVRGMPLYLSEFDPKRQNNDELHKFNWKLIECPAYGRCIHNGGYERSCPMQYFKNRHAERAKLDHFELLQYYNHHWRSMVIDMLVDEDVDIESERYTKRMKQLANDFINEMCSSVSDYTYPNTVKQKKMFKFKTVASGYRDGPKDIFGHYPKGENRKVYLLSSFIQHSNGPVTEANLKSLLEITEEDYNMITSDYQLDLPRIVKFKTINPGEQSNGSFHPRVIKDPRDYFKGRFYKLDDE